MDLKEPLIKANRVLKYSITYQEITEESREYGEVSDSGFIIENETDEIGNLLKLAVETYGIYYPVAFGWWESTNPVQNRDYFEKGIEIYYALHIKNEDGTDITENEFDFITFLLSDGNYNKDEFTEYAIGGIVAGAIALGIGGLIAYYYFNKGKKGYPTGRAWTKEHYNDNDDEDYEVSPNERNIKHKARNRQFDNGGEIIRFDRHASMDSATRNELVEMTSYPFLLEYGVEENGEIKYDRIKSLLEREGVKVYSIKNYLSGLFDGYNYSNTDDFKKEMAKLKIADKEFYDRIIKVYEKISKYPKIDKMMANGGGIEKEKSLRHFILEQVSSGMIANKIPYSDYKTIDAIRFTALQILNRDGDREYSMKSFSDLIQEALLEYEENKYENKFDNGGNVSQTQLDAYRFVDEIVEIHKDKNKVKQVILDRVNSAYGRTSNQFVDEMWDRYNMIFYKEDYPHLFTDGGAVSDEIIIKSGNNGNLKVIYHAIKNQRTELNANEVFEQEKIKGKSVFLFVNDELYDEFIADGDENKYADGGMAGLGEVSGMLPNALPMSAITPMANGGEIKTLEKSLENAEKNYRKAILSEQVGIISPTELNRAKNKVDSIRAKVNEWYASRPLGKRMANGGGVGERLVGTFYYDTRKDKAFQIISEDGTDINGFKRKDGVVDIGIQYYDNNKQPIGKIEIIDKGGFEYYVQMGAYKKYQQPYFSDGGGVENAEMPTRERTTITKPTTTPTTTPSKPDKKNPYKPKHIPKPKAIK